MRPFEASCLGDADEVPLSLPPLPPPPPGSLVCTLWGWIAGSLQRKVMRGRRSGAGGRATAVAKEGGRRGGQVVEETVADDDVLMIKGCKSSRAVTVLLRGANDYLLDEMDRSLHDAFCIVKRVLESGSVVPGAHPSFSHPTPPPRLISESLKCY